MSFVTKIKIGTCAWSYDDWRGVFYPEHLPSEERLAYFARHFSAVEVDSTFYGAPAEHTVAHWADVTPADFAFSCKLPQEITHNRRLRDSTVPLQQFLAAMEGLGRKLWCVVVQLPPSFRPKRDEVALKDFLRELPDQVRFAFEFRHPDWHHPRIAHLLQAHRASWVWNDLTTLERQEEGAFAFQPDTSDFAYVRLMGDLEVKYDADGRNPHRYRKLQWPRDAAIESWGVRLKQAVGEHRRIFVAVSNHFEGYAPETVRRLGEKVGIPVTLPDVKELGGQQLELL